jgi:hypothetical protein
MESPLDYRLRKVAMNADTVTLVETPAPRLSSRMDWLGAFRCEGVVVGLVIA